jgi:2-methylisocitrate lyase-like PEP mutase family enzyme
MTNSRIFEVYQMTDQATDQTRKADLFRGLHIPGKPLVLFNIWDAGSARAVAAAGAKALATGSWSVAHANGYEDGEHAPLDLAIDNLRRIAGATELPVSIDLESGYGATAEEAGATFRRAIEAGAVGCNLEDSVPATGKLRAAVDQADRIRNARRAADEAKINFFINARTDVFFQRPADQHDDAMVAEAVERAHVYAEAGADGLFAPGLKDLTLIARLAKASPLPINIMMADATASWSALAEQGVARVSYGPRPYLLAMKAVEDAARGANFGS